MVLTNVTLQDEGREHEGTAWMAQGGDMQETPVEETIVRLAGRCDPILHRWIHSSLIERHIQPSRPNIVVIFHLPRAIDFNVPPWLESSPRSMEGSRDC